MHDLNARSRTGRQGMLVAQLRAVARQVEPQLLEYFNPELEKSFTLGWPLVSLDDAATVVLVYIAATFFGSRFMRGRQPSSGPALRYSMIMYNAFQVVLCAYMAGETARQFWLLNYRPICNNALVLLPGKPFETTGMSDIMWIFYLSKVLDFCDTAFIVLRKKDRQLSFLHVFHHTSIFLVYYLQVAVAYNGDGYLSIVLNSVVHLMMYSYYGLIAAFPGYSPPWKHWVTKLQMGQFCCMISQAGYMLTMCPHPGRRVTVMYAGYISFLLGLFLNFSQKAYANTSPGNSKSKLT